MCSLPILIVFVIVKWFFQYKKKTLKMYYFKSYLLYHYIWSGFYKIDKLELLVLYTNEDSFVMDFAKSNQNQLKLT